MLVEKYGHTGACVGCGGLIEIHPEHFLFLALEQIHSDTVFLCPTGGFRSQKKGEEERA